MYNYILAKVSLGGFALPQILVKPLQSNSCLWFIGGTIYEIYLKLLALEAGEAILSINWTFNRLSLGIWSSLPVHHLKCCMTAIPEEFVVTVPFVCCKEESTPNPVSLQFYLQDSFLCFKSLKLEVAVWCCVNLWLCNQRLHKWMLCGIVEWISIVFDELHNQLIMKWKPVSNLLNITLSKFQRLILVKSNYQYLILLWNQSSKTF